VYSFFPYRTHATAPRRLRERAEAQMHELFRRIATQRAWADNEGKARTAICATQRT
jgi:hypothetical protein